MTHFLITEENPDGLKLEDVLKKIRADVINRCGKIVNDPNTIAEKVVGNNIKILGLISEAINLAENSTQLLDKSFGPSGDTPRIGD